MEEAKTTALLQQKLQSLNPVHQWWFDRMCDPQFEGNDLSGWPDRIPLERLHRDYVEWARRAGIRRTGAVQPFGKKLRDCCPEIRHDRVAVGDDSYRGLDRQSRGRVAMYEFPSLGDCRRQFETFMGHPMEWPALSPEPETQQDLPF